MPKVDLKAIELTRLKAEVTDEAMADALENFSKRFQEYEPPAKARKSKEGDRLTIDFLGKVDGEAFEGGKADDFPLVLGSGSFIPGFEDQLVGKKADDEVEVKVTFPESYGAENLAGKDAVFDVKVKEIAEPKPVELSDDLAKGFRASTTWRRSRRRSARAWSGITAVLPARGSSVLSWITSPTT